MFNKLITDLFYGRPTIEIKNGKIYFSAKPKFHFFKKGDISFQQIIGEKLNVSIPIVDTHTQFGRELNRRIGEDSTKMIYLLFTNKKDYKKIRRVLCRIWYV